jgi:hypothetical protein
MAVRIITSEEGEQCLFDSTTMMAFGPVHDNNKDHDLEDFLEWLPKDPRKYTIDELMNAYYEWIKAEQLVDSLNENT